MQLRQTEALGVFNHHQRSIGHVHTYLDNRSAHQYLQLACRKAVHNRILLRALQPAMQQSAGNVLQKIALQLLVYSFSTMYSKDIGFLNQRADNVGLPSRLHLTHQAGVNLTAALIRIAQRPHRLALRRTSLHYGNIQIAVNSERQGTRNRRCRHYQYIGSIGRFIGQTRTLLYTEAVLLVRHRQ